METTTPAETTIKGTTYTITKIDTAHLTLLRADMIRRGWDGETYLLTGKRGAQWSAFRSARSGEFELVTNLGRSR